MYIYVHIQQKKVNIIHKIKTYMMTKIFLSLYYLLHIKKLFWDYRCFLLTKNAELART